MIIEYTDHAILRMRQRDIIEEDIQYALDKPLSAHRLGIRYNRFEVDAIIGNRIITIVYERVGNVFKIITVF